MIDKLREWLQTKFSKRTRKIMIGIVGSVVVLVGVLMIFIPGPAFIVIPAGLAILAMEFEWAHRYYEKVKGWMQSKGWVKGEQPEAKKPEAKAKKAPTPGHHEVVARKRTVKIKRRQRIVPAKTGPATG
ncbi:MAG: putative rane protein [Verrucomicrobia bacterium]|jgi:hypothetical protein|nr:putative rane protein [Verrucomicrobiota bacterium]